MHVSAGIGVRSDPRSARARHCRSTAKRCTSTSCTRPRTTSGPTARCTTPIRRSSRKCRPGRRCGQAMSEGTLHTVATDEVCCSLNGQDAWASASTTRRAATSASSRAWRSCTRRWSAGAAIAREVRRPRLDQRGEDHGAVSAQGRARRRLRRRHHGARSGARARRSRKRCCTNPTTRHGKATKCMRGRRYRVARQGRRRGWQVFSGELKDGQYLLRKISEEIRSGAML